MATELYHNAGDASDSKLVLLFQDGSLRNKSCRAFILIFPIHDEELCTIERFEIICSSFLVNLKLDFV